MTYPVQRLNEQYNSKVTTAKEIIETAGSNRTLLSLQVASGEMSVDELIWKIESINNKALREITKTIESVRLSEHANYSRTYRAGYATAIGAILEALGLSDNMSERQEGF